MGKNQHSKDRMYITATEWAAEWGGHKKAAHTPFKRLPFYCCGLSLQPVEDPVCTKEGVVFDILNIIPFVRKHHRNPVTGEPLAVKDLVRIHFHKNADGEFICPVTYKVLNENSHIVALKTSGNVYSHQTIEELCIKAKNWHDLITNEEFRREDIITIQDPQNWRNRQIEGFFCVREGLTSKEGKEGEKQQRETINVEANRAIKRTLETIAEKNEKSEKKTDPPVAEEKRRKAEGEEPSSTVAPATRKPLRTTGQMAMSLTSTFIRPVTVNESATMTEEDMRQRRYAWLKRKGKKAYVQLTTTLGPLNLELHCDVAPRACENFVTLCERGKYDGIVFHRSIRNFMIQGGDPTGKGKGGQSCWGKPFKDEFHPKYTHSGRGVVSMANSGPDTNGSQFFITFRSCNHLDNKHSVFGRVVGGNETLSKMEHVPTDQSDRPLTEIKLVQTKVFVSPFAEAEEAIREEDEAAARQETKDDDADERGQWFSNPVPTPTLEAMGSGVGKYLRAQQQQQHQQPKTAKK